MGFFRPIAPGGAGGGANITALTNATLRDNELIFNRNNNAAPIVVDLKDFASVIKDNNFTGANNFQELTLGGVQYDNRDFGNVGTDTGNRYFGVRSQSSGLFYKGYVESLRFYIHTNGNTQYIDNVSVWTVTKGQNIGADIVAGQIVTNQRFNIQPRGANAQLDYIEIPIGQEFADDTYFVAYIPRTGGNSFQALDQIPQQFRNEYVNMSVAPVVGGRVENEGNRGYCVYSEIRGRINVKEELLKRPGGNAGVSDVTYDPVTKELVVTTNGVVARHSLLDLVDITNVTYNPATKELSVTNSAGTVNHDLSGLADVTEVRYDEPTKHLVIERNGVENRVSLENLVDVTDVRYDPQTKELLVTNPAGVTRHDLTTLVDVTEVTYDDVAKELVVNRNGNPTRLDLKNLVDVTDVRYDNGTKKLIVEKQGGVPVEYDLDGLMTSINNVDPQNGNINLELNIVNDEIVLSANGNEIQKTSLNGYVKRDELTTVGGAGNQDKVPQLGADGKLSGTMMPDLAITQVVDVTSQQEALDKIASGDIQVGDVVVVDPNNEIYMYNGTPAGGTFEDSFVQLSLGDGTVKEVNGQRPVANGQVVVESEHIPYNKQTSNLQADNVQAAIDEVVTQLNSRAEDITNTGTELQLLGKNNVVLGRVQLMTQQEVTNIIDQFV